MSNPTRGVHSQSVVAEIAGIHMVKKQVPGPQGAHSWRKIKPQSIDHHALPRRHTQTIDPALVPFFLS